MPMETRVVTNHLRAGAPLTPNSRLTIPVTFTTDCGTKRAISLLVDTGSEVNLIRENLLPPDCFSPAEHPIRMTAANHSSLSGGQLVVTGTVSFEGTDIDSKIRVNSDHRIVCYDADIAADMIVSYEWLATHGIDVRAFHHGIQINK